MMQRLGFRERLHETEVIETWSKIVGEFIASQHGLGRTIIYAGQTYDIALVWVAVSVLSALAIVMYVTVSWIERVLHRGVKG